MDRDEIRECVIESLCEIVGDKGVPSIDEETDPMLIFGLDSEDGVDLACVLSDKLNYNIPEKINPLVDDERNRPRRVGEITDLVCDLIAESKRESHE